MPNKFVTALFDKPDAIANAARAVVKAGYTKFDVHTPYPLHGMDPAMGLKPSKLGYVPMSIGLLGTTTAFTLATWVMAHDYKINVGGKPLISLPAFVPIMFELSILFAGLSCVIGLILFFLKLPNNSHPLHNSSYMAAVSSDRFGICIEGDDPKFDENKVLGFLKELGGMDVGTIVEKVQPKPSFLSAPFAVIVLAAAALTSGATYVGLNDLTTMLPFNWMHEQNRLDPQTQDNFFANNMAMREPPQGTVPRGTERFMYGDNPDGAGAELSNPMPFNEENLAQGQKYFGIYCAACHGENGDGKNNLNGKFPNPPSFHSKKVREWSDGRIYHVITMGQNVMPSYAKQVPAEIRWNIIHYLRTLQRSQNAKETDAQ